jgi:type IV pilus biogenesis protein PilP
LRFAMKLSKKSNSKLLAGALVGIALAGSAAAIAQVSSAPPAAPSAPPANVVAPVVPTAPAQNPGAVAAIEQSVLQAPAPQVSPPVSGAAPATAASYQVPAAGPGIFEGSDQTLREIAYLQTEVALNGKRKERIESMSALKEAERGFVDVLAGKSKDDKGGAGPGGAAAPGATAVPIAVIVKPEAYVNSVYGYGNDMYAEIVIGSTKVLASKGTVLSDGSRVTAISSSGVTVSGKKGTKRLLVRGAAGY